MRQPDSRWDVFLSYSRKDAEAARPLLDALHDAGLSIWFDLEERPGAPISLPLLMTHGLLESRVLCLLLSSNAIASSWVRLEFQTFMKRFSGYWDNVGHGPVALFVPLDEREFNLELLKLPHTSDGRGFTLENMTPEFLEQLVEPLDFLICRPIQALRLEPAVEAKAPERVATQVRDVVNQCVAQAAGPTPEPRTETAARYWADTRPNSLAHWDADEIPRTLEAFDGLHSPYDQWPGLPEDDDKTELEALVDEVIQCGATGLNYAALFAEAVGAATMPRFASIDDHIDPELETVFPGLQHTNQVVNTGSPVDLLVNIAVDYPLIEPLQHAYYRARLAGLDQRTRDGLDQTVMMALGYAIQRWQNAGVGVKDVVFRLIEQKATPDSE